MLNKMKKIILAIDEIQNLDEVIALVKKVGHLVYAVKIHNLYDKFGSDIIDKLKQGGADKVWVDFKLYDIPNTVQLRAESINADILSVHASGGVEMMKKAVLSGKEIFAVTMLTSFSESEVKQIYNRELKEMVLILVQMAKEAGVSGVVCSPQEIKLIKNYPEFSNLKIITPGVRSLDANLNDQNRVSTPAQAILDGADYLVIGRQVTQSLDPVLEIQKICEEVGEKRE